MKKRPRNDSNENTEIMEKRVKFSKSEFRSIADESPDEKSRSDIDEEISNLLPKTNIVQNNSDMRSNIDSIAYESESDDEEISAILSRTTIEDRTSSVNVTINPRLLSDKKNEVPSSHPIIEDLPISLESKLTNVNGKISYNFSKINQNSNQGNSR